MNLKEKTCSICGKIFMPKHFNQTRCEGPHYKKCPICGKDIPWTEYDRCCSNECTNIKRKQTSMEKYGVAHWQHSEVVRNKSKQTCLEHYGVEYPGQDPKIRAKQLKSFDEHYGKETNPEGFSKLDRKRRDSCLEKYGVEYSFQSDNNKIKSKETSLKRYGCEYPMQNPEIKQRFVSSMLEKYGCTNIMQTDEGKKRFEERLIEKYGYNNLTNVPEIRERIISTNLRKYNVPWYCMTYECKLAQGTIVSKNNKLFASMINDKGIDTELEYRIGFYSFDIRANDVLIEINPGYTHNCLYNPYDKTKPGRTKDYHINKTKLAECNGFRCVHIFDWDNWSKIINSLFDSKIALFARKCSVRLISHSECDDFLINYHFQNSCRGQSIRLGLFYDDELVQVMTFGKPRYNKNYEWELLRLCTKSNYIVVGGASRLFTYFIHNYNPQSIISYCDRSKFKGNIYSTLNMTLVRETEPSKIWCKGVNHITDNLLRQRGYDQLFGTSYGKGTSNEQLMLDHDWYPVYDCGQYVYEWRNNG